MLFNELKQTCKARSTFIGAPVAYVVGVIPAVPLLVYVCLCRWACLCYTIYTHTPSVCMLEWSCFITHSVSVHYPPHCHSDRQLLSL